MRKFLFSVISIFIFISCNNNTIQEQNEQQETSNQKPKSFEEHEREEMLKFAQQPKENPYKNSQIDVKTFKDSLGWGYDIFIDKNQYVHQPHIPAVPGNRGFSKEEFAKKAGEFVAYKIRNNIMPPSVTPEELDSLGVLK